MDIKDTQAMIEALSDFFTLTPQNLYFARLEIKQIIPTDASGTNTIEPGTYFMDADGIIYRSQEVGDNAPLPTTVLKPLTRNGTQVALPSLIFFIGEYVGMPDTTNEYFDNYFRNGAAELQDITLPDEIIAPTDRVTRSYFNGLLSLGEELMVNSGHDITVMTTDGKMERRPLAPVVTVSLLDLPPGITISREPTDFDNCVFNAVCSLYERGNDQFTGHDIYRTMTGNHGAKATKETLHSIDESWTRLTTTMMRLDSGTMGNAYDFAQYIRDRRIIEGGRDEVIHGNQHGIFAVVCYTIQEKPMLLEYAQLLNQVSRYPTAEQNTPVSKTLEMIAIQNALLDHVHAIPRLSNHILYSRLYNLSDRYWEKRKDNQENKDTTKGYTKLRRKRTRDAVHKILDYWQQQGVIVSWHDIKRGNSIYAIEINTKKSS